MSNKHWAQDAQETISLLAEESALLTLRGMGLNEQVKQLREKVNIEVTRTRLISLKRHPKYKEIYTQAANDMVESGQIELKTGAADLVPEVIKCLKAKLQEGDVKAASVVFNILSDKKDEDGPKQAQQIQVILPGAPKPDRPV